jgi:uncharacterized protein DUF4325
MRYRMADHGRVFSTRDRGARLLADFDSAYTRDASVVIDFAGVLSMTHSFADEFVGELLARSNRGELPAPRLENLAEVPRRAVERCADVRGVPAPLA